MYSSIAGVAGGTGTLDIDTTDLDALTDGFSKITIGRTDGTGDVTFGDTSGYTFDDSVLIRAGARGGDITIADALATSGANDTIEIIGNQQMKSKHTTTYFNEKKRTSLERKNTEIWIHEGGDEGKRTSVSFSKMSKIDPHK